MIDLNTRWPLAARPIDCGRYYAANIRAAVYQTACVLGIDNCGSSTDVEIVLAALAGLPKSDRPTVIRALAMAGVAPLLAGLVLRAAVAGAHDRQTRALMGACGGDVAGAA